jgi:type II secretory pathway pseudopilin PulG
MRTTPAHQKATKSYYSGTTILEFVVVIIILGILGALFLSTYASIQRNDRNQERQRDINSIYQQLEAYYVENSQYPTLPDMNSTTWLQANMKTLNPGTLRDPSGKANLLVARPEKAALAYQVSSATGAGCNDTSTPCAHYTLTATLENSPEKVYVKTSLN